MRLDAHEIGEGYALWGAPLVERLEQRSNDVTLFDS